MRRNRRPREPYTVCKCCRTGNDCYECAEKRRLNIEHECYRYTSQASKPATSGPRGWWARLWDGGIIQEPSPEQLREARESVARQTAEAAARRAEDVESS